MYNVSVMLLFILSFFSRASAAECITEDPLQQGPTPPKQPVKTDSRSFTAYTKTPPHQPLEEDTPKDALYVHHSTNTNCTQTASITSIFLHNHVHHSTEFSLGISLDPSLTWTPGHRQFFATFRYISNRLDYNEDCVTRLCTRIIDTNSYAIAYQQGTSADAHTLFTLRNRPQPQEKTMALNMTTSHEHHPTAHHSNALHATWPLQDTSFFVSISSASSHTVTMHLGDTTRSISLTPKKTALIPSTRLCVEKSENANVICKTTHTFKNTPENKTIATYRTKEDFSTTLYLERSTTHNERITMTTKTCAIWGPEDTFLSACVYTYLKGTAVIKRRSLHIVTTQQTRSLPNQTFSISVRGSFGAYFLGNVNATYGAPTSVLRSATTDSVDAKNPERNTTATTHTLYLAGEPIVTLEASSKGLTITSTNNKNRVRFYYNAKAEDIIYSNIPQED